MLLENIRAALAGIKANKMRSFLTMLGILIGIAAIIAIIIAGNGMTQYVADLMSQYGANKMIFWVEQKDWDDYSVEWKDSDSITLDMIRDVYDHFSSEIEDVGMTTNLGEGVVKQGKAYAKVNVLGVNTDGLNLQVENENMLAGRKLTTQEQKSGANTAVVSDKFVSNLYHGDNEAALNQTVDVLIGNQYYTYTIVGVYQSYQYQRMTTSEYDVLTNVYVPLKAVHNVIPESKTLSDEFYMNAKQDVDPVALSSEICEYINKTYYRNNKNFHIVQTTMKEEAERANDQTNMIKTVLGAIGAISLLVGGIGVMNIMIVSITERTREIGTRKALGATNGSIRMQFIVEAVVICFIGGMLGMGLGFLLGRLISGAIGFPGTITTENVIFCLLFSMGFGVFFGYYPANRAAKMNPIDALRYE